MKLKATAYLRIAAEDWRGKYDYVDDFFEGLAPVYLNGKYGFVNKEGVEVVPPKYDYVGGFDKGFAKVGLKSKSKYGFSWGFVNTKGEVVVPPKYDAVQDFKWNTRDFDDDLAQVELNDRYGYINKKCEEVIPVKYTKKEIEQIPTAIDLLASKLKVSKEEAQELLFEEMKEL